MVTAVSMAPGATEHPRSNPVPRCRARVKFALLARVTSPPPTTTTRSPYCMTHSCTRSSEGSEQQADAVAAGGRRGCSPRRCTTRETHWRAYRYASRISRSNNQNTDQQPGLARAAGLLERRGTAAGGRWTACSSSTSRSVAGGLRHRSRWPSRPSIRAETLVCVTGAPAEVQVSGVPAPMWEPFTVSRGRNARHQPGSGPPESGRASSWQHSIDVPDLGSAATFTLAGSAISEHQLRAGDVLRPAPAAAAAAQEFAHPLERPTFTHDWELTVVPGPHAAPIARRRPRLRLPRANGNCVQFITRRECVVRTPAAAPAGMPVCT